MRRKLWILPVLLLLASCTWMQPPQPDHQPIEAGIRLTIWQMDLQEQYNDMLKGATEEQAEQLRENVAPLLDEAKYELALYNDAVLVGERPLYKEHEIRDKLRDAEREMEDIADGT